MGMSSAPAALAATPGASLAPFAASEVAGPAFAVVLGPQAAASAGSPAAAGPPNRPSPDRPSPVTAALARLADGQRGIDRLLEAAAHGRTFTPAQLLALQATVSRDAQAVEVVSRVADRVVGAVKQALGAQI